MNANQPTPQTFHQRLVASLAANRDSERWEHLLNSLLERLELNPIERADAVEEYEKLANDVATRLDIPRHDIAVYAQGSMRTQTTIAQRGNAKFDIDVVVELSGPKYQNPNSEEMFQEFGEALDGNEDVTGKAERRRRCWTLYYPNKPYYFDVTPGSTRHRWRT
jgi:hypothetical protein